MGRTIKTLKNLSHFVYNDICNSGPVIEALEKSGLKPTHGINDDEDFIEYKRWSTVCVCYFSHCMLLP